MTDKEILSRAYTILNDRWGYVCSQEEKTTLNCIQSVIDDLNAFESIAEKNADERYGPRPSPTTHVFCPKCGFKHDFHKMCMGTHSTKT